MSNKNDHVITFQIPALFYDEKCPLCLRFKQSLQRIELSEEIHYYPIQLKGIYPHFSKSHGHFTEEALAEEVHFITGDNELLKGQDAISYLVRLNKKVAKFSWLLESKMGQKVIDLFYETSNRYRKTLRKRCHQCNHS